MKFTVKRFGYTKAEESMETQLELAEITKETVAAMIESAAFYARKDLAANESSTGETVKRQIKITVEISDVKPSKTKRNSNRKPDSKAT